MNGRLLFTADDGVHGIELWTTDGTAGATRLVKDICPGSCTGNPGGFIDLGGVAVFTASDASGSGLWRTDGTEEGTARAPDLVPGAFSGPRNSARLGQKTVFRGFDAEHGTELWITDGTASGSSLLRDIRPGRESSMVRSSRLETVGDRVLFAADDGDHGLELWGTDGTPDGTALVADICPGPCSGAAAGLQFEGSVLARVFCFFGATEKSNSTSDGSITAFWRTDGTPEGTYAIGPPFKLDYPFITRSMAVAGGQVLFVSGPPDDTVLMKSDGTREATLVSKAPKDPDQLVEWRGSVFFTARDAPSASRELWKTDGSEAGTVRLKDVLGVPTGPDPLNLSPYRGMLFYGVSDLVHGTELWATDGTGPGTGMLGDIWAGAGSGLPTAGHRQPEAGIIFGLGDRVYFVGSDGRSGEELWSYRVPAQ